MNKVLLSIATLAAFYSSANSFAAPLHCQPVEARIQSTVFTDGCMSPVGLCTQGRVIGGGITGKSNYSALTLAPAAGDPTSASTISYSGQLKILTHWGELTVNDLGVLDRKGGSFSELSTSLSGTDHLKGVTGRVFIHGDASETGFSGRIHGELCY